MAVSSNKSRLLDQPFQRFWGEATQKHWHTQPLTRHPLNVVCFRAHEQIAPSAKPPADAPQECPMLLTRNVLQGVEGNHYIESAYWELDRGGICVQEMARRDILAGEVDLRLRNIDARELVRLCDFDIRRIT